MRSNCDVMSTCLTQATQCEVNSAECSFNVFLTSCVSGRRGAFVPRGAGEVSDLRRVQKQTARFPPNHPETVCDVGDQLQCPVGGRGTHTNTHTVTHKTHTHTHCNTPTHTHTHCNTHTVSCATVAVLNSLCVLIGPSGCPP